jgi:DNA-directed RNA polymerase subunit RPC12/RpoP
MTLQYRCRRCGDFFEALKYDDDNEEEEEMP